MCENDAVDEKIEEKPAAATPSASTGSLGAAKVFILTPELLQTLGLSGYANPRKADKDVGKIIKGDQRLPLEQVGQEASHADKSTESAITLGKLVQKSMSNSRITKEASTSNTNDVEKVNRIDTNVGKTLTVISPGVVEKLNVKSTSIVKKQKRNSPNVIKASRRNSVHLKNVDNTMENSLLLAEVSRKAEQALNGIRQEESAIKTEIPSGVLVQQGKSNPRMDIEASTSNTNIIEKANSIDTGVTNKPTVISPSDVEKPNIKSTTAIKKQSRSSPGVSKASRRNSVHLKNSDDTTETLKLLTQESEGEEQTPNGINQEKSVTKTEILSGSTPIKAKRGRRRSSAVDTRDNRALGLNDRDAVETNRGSDTGAPAPRTSRRVAKPKKFDDFVLTENLLNHGRIAAANNDATSEKPRSRRSSLNSETPQTAKKITQGTTKTNRKEKHEAIASGSDDKTMLKETGEESDAKQQNSGGVRRLSSPDDCFAVPESPAAIRRKSVDQTHDKRRSRNIPRRKSVDERSVKKKEELTERGVEVADSELANSDTRNVSPLRIDSKVLPNSPNTIYGSELLNISEASIITENATTKTASEEKDSAFEKEPGRSASEQRRTEIKDSLSNIGSSKDEKEKHKNIASPEDNNEKDMNIARSEDDKEKNKNIVSGKDDKEKDKDIPSCKDDKEKSLSPAADEPSKFTREITFRPEKPASVSSRRTEEIIISKTDVPNDPSKRIKGRSPKSTRKRSLVNKEETSGSKSDPPRASNNEEKMISSRTNSDKTPERPKSDKRQRLLSEFYKPKQDCDKESSSPSDINTEACDAKSDLPKSVVKQTEANPPKSISLSSPVNEETPRIPKRQSSSSSDINTRACDPKSEPLKSVVKKREANPLKSISLSSPVTEDPSRIPKRQKSSSSDLSTKACDTKSDLPKSVIKKEEPNPPKSISLSSPVNEETPRIPKRQSSSSSVLSTKACGTKSDLPKSMVGEKEANPPKSISLSSPVTEDPSRIPKRQTSSSSDLSTKACDTRSDLPKSVVKRKEANPLKSISLSSPVTEDASRIPKRQTSSSSDLSTKACDTKSDPPKSVIKKEEPNPPKSNSLSSPVTEETPRIPKRHSSRSVHRKEASISNLERSRSPLKNEKKSTPSPVLPESSSNENEIPSTIIEDARSSRSTRRKSRVNINEPSSSKQDRPKSPKKKDVVAVVPPESDSVETCVSESIQPSRAIREEASVPRPRSARTSSRQKSSNCSKLDSTKSLDDEEENSSRSSVERDRKTETPRRSGKKKKEKVTQLAPPSCLDRNEVSTSKVASLTSVDDAEDSVAQPDTPESSNIKKSIAGREEETTISNPASATSPENTEDRETTLNVSSIVGKREEVGIVQLHPPKNPVESGETCDAEAEETLYEEIIQETNIVEIETPWSPCNVGDSGWIGPTVSKSPRETQINDELSNIGSNVDNHPEETASSQVSTVEAIQTDDAISAETTSDIKPEPSVPLEELSRRDGSPRFSNTPEPSVVPEVDCKMEIEETVPVENPVGSTLRSRRSVQRDEDVTDGKGLSDGSEDDADIDFSPRRRGRPPGIVQRGSMKRRGRGRGRGRGGARKDTEYIPRVASSGKEKSKTRETASSDNTQQPQVGPPNPGEIECGKCNARMEKKKWPVHNLGKHNNTGWLSGDPKPDYENDLKLLRSVLTSVLKRKKKSQLVCETCGDGKRSANGFISHIQFCGKTEDEQRAMLMTCPVCKHVLMPSSMEMHVRTHRQDDKTPPEKSVKEAVVMPPPLVREKRKAAEKAEKKILEFTVSAKDDEPAAKKRRRRTKEELVELIDKPQPSGNAPNRYKGIWKIEIKKAGEAACRHEGCTFTSDSIEVLCTHHSECSFSPRSKYICKICLFSSKLEEEAMKHVEAEHSIGKSTGIEDSDFENSDDGSDSEDSDSSGTKPTAHRREDRYPPQDYNVKFLDEEVKVDSRWPFSYPPALRWSMEFECKNYRLRLFENLSPNPMRLLEREEQLEYLPKLIGSMKICESEARGTKPARWIHLERFEGTVTAGNPTFFAGGPVWAVAWLPIPAPMYNKSVDQFVAVSTHPSMTSVYEVGKSHTGKNIIQIWNLGPQDHGRSSAVRAPVLSYGVAHNRGTIWCMEWCPSGCYEHPSLLESEEPSDKTPSRKRMGLLATACSDGCVHVYSLPFPDDLSIGNKGSKLLPIYETKPILTLTINTRLYDQGEQNWQCTKLNWSRELGHDTIIAGFSNGHVALWDLATKSPLFVTKRGETTFIDAFHHLYAHGHAVSAVQLIPYGGNRFFVTSSYDRMTQFWDLEDTSHPTTAIKRGVTADGVWLTHWPAYLTSHDDVLTHANTYLISVRQPGAKFFPLLPTSSPTYSVATSDYGNSVGHGSLAGEVTVMFPGHLWSYRDMERITYKKRWLASSVELVDLQNGQDTTKKKKTTKEYEYMPETYDECTDKYGLFFRDRLNRANTYCRKQRSFTSKLKPVQPEEYPIASVNRISWNPNAWSHLWLCAGYQNGLVRFLNFNVVALDKELRNLLPAHARTMLNEKKTLRSQ